MDQQRIFENRTDIYIDELKELYMSLYNDEAMFNDLRSRMLTGFSERDTALKTMDQCRETNPDWYKAQDMNGMMLYIDNFSKDFPGLLGKLDYIEDCQVNLIHLMPFLDVPEENSDGGYAVSDFRKIRPDLGTMADLEAFTRACHERGMNVCMDFVMNHTSDEHEWAIRAKAGEKEYMDRYFFFDDRTIPDRYDAVVPQVFPTTAPGNFTWLEQSQKWVMTQFYPYQWDLNYSNPIVFNEMISNFLYLADRGIDVVRIDAVPYIWKTFGTNCRNLPEVHRIVRMLRLICEIVCPGVLLLGEVVMAPEKVVPYFGTPEKPECHMLYNVTSMATTWHTVATRDTKLLKMQMDIVSRLPKQYTYLNYLRCHDDIGWGLDYDALRNWGQEEAPHKDYLNRYFTGKFYGSESRGELYNSDPATGDARFCGTTASMCGIEFAYAVGDQARLSSAIDFDITLHALMMTQSGIPMLYSGDEIGQFNDYHYKDDPKKAADSRYIHRGRFNWKNEKKRFDPTTLEYSLFNKLSVLEHIRQHESVFNAKASTYTHEVYNDHLLCIVRQYKQEILYAIFNFDAFPQTAYMQEDGDFRDLITSEAVTLKDPVIPGHGFLWCRSSNPLPEKSIDVVALGELLIDFTENGTSTQGNPILEANPGGAPCNVLAMLNRLGKKTAFIGKVGTDQFGHMLADVVKKSGTDISALKMDDQVRTTLAFVHTKPDGDREFSFYRNPGADMMLRKDEVDVELIKKARIFHFGTLSSTHEGVREATRHALKCAMKNGALISFDPNLREPLWDSLEHAREEIAYGLSRCNILKISDNEIEFMTGTNDYDLGVAMLRARYDIDLIFVTLGKDGSRAYYKNMIVEASPFIQENTIETTGAGDTFCACALNYVLEHGFDNLTESDLKDLLIFANAGASLITTKKGALKVMPEKNDILELIAKQ